MAKSNSKLHEAIKSMDIAEINTVLAAAQEQLRLRLIVKRRELAAIWVKQAAELDAIPEEILKYESSPLPINNTPTVPRIHHLDGDGDVYLTRDMVLEMITTEPKSTSEICQLLKQSKNNMPMVYYYLKNLMEEKRLKRVGKRGSYKYHV